jgi:hypothetical protein
MARRTQQVMELQREEWRNALEDGDVFQGIIQALDHLQFRRLL